MNAAEPWGSPDRVDDRFDRSDLRHLGWHNISFGPSLEMNKYPPTTCHYDGTPYVPGTPLKIRPYWQRPGKLKRAIKIAFNTAGVLAILWCSSEIKGAWDNYRWHQYIDPIAKWAPKYGMSVEKFEETVQDAWGGNEETIQGPPSTEEEVKEYIQEYNGEKPVIDAITGKEIW